MLTIFNIHVYIYLVTAGSLRICPQKSFKSLKQLLKKFEQEFLRLSNFKYIIGTDRQTDGMQYFIVQIQVYLTM